MNITASRPRRILLVEDNKDEVELATTALKRLKHLLDIRIARDGQQAVEIILESSWRPELVFLDLNLPLLDGIEVLQRVRAHYPCGTIPMVMLTTSRDPHDQQRALAAKCDEFHAKPLSFKDSALLFQNILDRWFAA